LGCVVSLAGWPALATESLPPSVRACSTITDSDERLACYDREVASFPAPAAKAAVKVAPTAGSQAVAAQGAESQPVAGQSTAGQGAAGQAAANRAAAVQAAVANAQTSVPGTNSAAANTRSNAAPAPASPAVDDAHISAHIVTIDHQPNQLVLHLDNGQVWQEMQSVSGDLSLREGDGVKIDRHFGAYWLSGPHVSSMKVQRKS
jgi:hypothetical protein